MVSRIHADALHIWAASALLLLKQEWHRHLLTGTKLLQVHFNFPLQQIVIEFFNMSHHPLQTFTLALPPTLLYVYASWHLIERRCIMLKPRAASLNSKSMGNTEDTV